MNTGIPIARSILGLARGSAGGSDEVQFTANEADMKPALLHRLGPLLGIVLFGIALWVLREELHQHDYRDVLRQLTGLPAGSLLLALAFTVLSYLTLTAYDVLALRYVDHPLPYGRTAFASFIGYAFSHSLGFSLLTGGSVRYRLYSAWGLSAAEITNVVAFCSLTFWLGFLALGGIAFVLGPLAVPGSVRLPFASVWPLGAAFLAAVASYVAWSSLRTTPFKILGWEFPVLPARLLLPQLAVACLDWALAGGVLYVLLPSAPDLSYPGFLGIYLLATIAGVASQVPGGLGIFESTLLLLLGDTLPAPAVLAALLAYRGVYYLLPLGLAVALLGAYEAAQQQEGLQRVARAVGWGISALAPHLLALGTFVGGAVLLVSGVMPAESRRLAWLQDIVPLPVIEVSHFLGSLSGMGLLLLARGLQLRLDAAYGLAVALLGGGIAFSLLKGLDYEEAAILAVMLCALLPSRQYFYRKASLIQERFTPGWIAAITLVLLGSIGLGLFAYQHVEYSADLWWRFALQGDAPRFLRATVGAIGLAIVVALARLLRPAPPEPGYPGPAELEQARAVIARSLNAAANLALLGDKRLLFSDTGRAFLMYGIQGRCWVALGDPVGPEDERADLVWEFRELCDRHNGWPVFYQVPPKTLPLYLDLGLSPLKLGEEARVALGSFSLEGGRRKGFRTLCHRLEREGWEFAVIPPEQVIPLLPELKTISDAWLAGKQTREKGFSLGFFDPAYLARFPAAVVRRAGRIAAFANIWLSADREELSPDLMRYHPEAPGGTMEYLFIQLMLWGKAEGYRWFGLGMAPLSGLENRALAPLWNRLCALAFRHGEHVYNFQGLRHYKEKFDPEWEPRYLVSPGGLALPIILVDVAALISGGLKGVVAR